MTIKQGGQYILINGNRTDHALEVSDDHKSGSPFLDDVPC
jgi:hypothetical protein